MKYISPFFVLIFLSSVQAAVTPEDVNAWIKTKPMLDPPAAGTVVTFDNVRSLEPWIVPGLFEEMSFPGTEITIQKTANYIFHETFNEATRNHAGEAKIGSDGALENFSAGQPFNHEQILEADAKTAGYMIAWNRVHRWRHFGPKSIGGKALYLGSTQSDAVPLNQAEGLLGGGTLERTLTIQYQRVYLNHLSMLADKNYRMKGGDSKVHFKELMGFLAPHNVAGTKFVIERKLDPRADDQVNIYSPTERRVRRLSAKERADRFMGSDFTLDDVEGFSGRTLDYNWTFLGMKKVLTVSDSLHESPKYFGPYSRVPHDRWQLRDSYVVEVTSIWDGHPYKKRIMFVDAQTFNITTELAIDRQDRLWKVFLATYKWHGATNGPTKDIQKSMPYPVMDGAIDIINNTASLVHVGKNIEFPEMTKRSVRRVFSVSALGEGK